MEKIKNEHGIDFFWELDELTQETLENLDYKVMGEEWDEIMAYWFDTISASHADFGTMART